MEIRIPVKIRNKCRTKTDWNKAKHTSRNREMLKEQKLFVKSKKKKKIRITHAIRKKNRMFFIFLRYYRKG